MLKTQLTIGDVYVGKIQKPRCKSENRNHRRLSGVCLALYCLGLVGCGTIKKAGIVATAAGTGAVAGTVFSGGAIAPIVGATTSAFVADAVVEVTDSSPTIMEGSCAPDNFWSLLGKLVEMGGWALILIIVVPIILGWILPGPLEKKKN